MMPTRLAGEIAVAGETAAVTLPEKITLLVRTATFGESSELGIVPARFVAGNGAVNATAFEALRDWMA
jgi:hypothetical protein